MLYASDFSDLDLKTLLDRECVEAHFQPIFSIREKKIIGFEGLSRGVHPTTGQLISPLQLLKHAKEAGLTLELDRLFRKKILETYQQCCSPSQGLLLTLNFETSIIDKEVGTLQLIQLCRQLHLDPTTIVIEILESKVRSVDALAKFVHIHREHGFLIALDDVGKGHSNFDRIPVIQPDIIKIDRSLVTDIHEDYYRQEIFRALVRLSQKIGALALAEGVETEDETMKCLELGSDLLQGFYFAKPQEPSQDFVKGLTNVIDPIAEKFRRQMVDSFNIRKMQHERYSLMMDTIVKDLAVLELPQMDGQLSEILMNEPNSKAIYVLDADGRQATSMSCKSNSEARKGIFKLSLKGTDYSLRDYFYGLMDPGFNRRTFTSEPYISPATGLFCITISTRFQDKKGLPLVLCVDVVPTYLKNMGRLMTLFGG
jgi:EAL domain-containing protein (putative c-di-GMP-specific phosphodiesterase class I)